MSATDVLVIGGGPAGLSAALALVRQQHSVILFDSEEYRNPSLQNLHLLPALENTPVKEFLATGQEELGKYPHFELKKVKLTSVKKVDEGFQVTDTSGTDYRGRKVILANGVVHDFPDLEGYAECWGRGIYHNLFSNGYEEVTEGKFDTSGVLCLQFIAMPKFALHLAHMAAQHTPDRVTLYTNGSEELANSIAAVSGSSPGWKFDHRVIRRIQMHPNSKFGIDVFFEDGSKTTHAFLAHSPNSKPRPPFQEQLGLEVGFTGDYEVKLPLTETSVKGVYTAGDNMTMFKVATNAIASGAQTASFVAIRLQEEKYGIAHMF